MNVACCEDGCRGIPNDNVPLFVSHLILVTLATASWILCAAVLKDDWPTHVESWLVFDLALAAAETLYGAWACVVDARDTTFFERATRSFLVADGVFATMQLAVAVTGSGAAWKSSGELGSPRHRAGLFRVDGVETPRHREDAAMETTSRRWRGAPEA